MNPYKLLPGVSRSSSNVGFPPSKNLRRSGTRSPFVTRPDSSSGVPGSAYTLSRMSKRTLRVATLAVAGLVLVSADTFAQTAPVRSIDRIAGDVYTFRNVGHYGIFAVTADGVVLVDPISVEAATWLKGQLSTRFPGKVVKTIVYSHHDGDHSGGAEVFKDTVTEIVAHENAPAGILFDDRVSVMPTDVQRPN